MIEIFNEPKSRPVSAYNNCVLEFRVTDNTPVKAVVTINGFPFDRAPSPTGDFYFEFKKIAATLINQDHFSDKTEITDNRKYLIHDSHLHLELNIEVCVKMIDGTEQIKELKYSLIKSVDQIVRKKVSNIADGKIKLLIPNSDKTSRVTYFEGLPFDFSIYSDQDREVTITNAGNSIELNLKKGVNRLFVSNGENDNKGFEYDLPLHLGVNELEIKINGSTYVTLFLKKIQACSGKYIKYFNQSGGWSYFRFKRLHKEKLKTKGYKTINKGFDNIENITSNRSMIGFEAEGEHLVSTGKIEAYERDQIKQLYTSPMVQLYMNENFQRFSISDFAQVKLSNNNINILSKSMDFGNMVLSYSLPKMYTQKL
ncbi:hypothetical protein ACFSTE_13280 [Aquimarina hainanensis]|uniref:Uncharacterized protein n=1 Tax=Aquimarina hainanensis TaxID=1578017 RepID=A0ABW5NC90_9FLAO